MPNTASIRLRTKLASRLINPTTGLEDEPSAGADVSAYPKDESGRPTNTAPLDPPEAGGIVTPPAPPEPAQDTGADVLPTDLIGDVPPPPVPAPPSGASIVGPGVGGVMGTEAGTLSRPGSRGAAPFRTQAFRPSPRFGPGAPMVGGGSTAVSGLNDMTTGGLTPEEAAELLAALAAGAGGGQ